ncbi:hypothetical protein OG542_36040 [Streptomyces violaceus]|uniref:carbonic anhydrase n=1 Tax=Streptomyces violaceus TaxID=1936 RepID=UPI002E223681|nr:carbonic anhydrase [Streptomyces violaceus]
MQPLIDNARAFGQRPEEFAGLAEGQSPEVLFIACADSRVVPALITGARPGELFELRTAGNIVPPYASEYPTSEAATVEYAEQRLESGHIRLHGWYYEVHTGAVREHRAATDTFEAL